MRQEPPVLSQPAPDARPGAAGPVAMAEDRSRSFGQDHAPGGGMSMILTKAFYCAFAVIAFGVGALGVVITLNDLSMVMLGAPLMLIGFACAVKCAFYMQLSSQKDISVSGDSYFSAEFRRDPFYYQTNEITHSRQAGWGD